MKSRQSAVVGLAMLAALVATANHASAALSDVFGLNSIVISPPSGTATPFDILTIQFSGVAGTSLVPSAASVLTTAPNERLIRLTNPNTIGVASPTPWSRQVLLGPLPAGSYDFSAAGIIGFGTLGATLIGLELAADDFLVVPEPSTLTLAALALLGAWHRRRTA
jgi:hypothetical protein